MSYYDEEAQKKQAEIQKLEEQKKLRAINDLRQILKTPEGRRFVWLQLERAGVFRASFTLNTAQTNFNEGARSVGLFLLADLMEAAPQVFYQMQRESASEAKSKQKEQENDRPS